jgi:hypothetical protein
MWHDNLIDADVEQMKEVSLQSAGGGGGWRW